VGKGTVAPTISLPVHLLVDHAKGGLVLATLEPQFLVRGRSFRALLGLRGQSPPASRMGPSLYLEGGAFIGSDGAGVAVGAGVSAMNLVVFPALGVGYRMTYGSSGELRHFFTLDLVTGFLFPEQLEQDGA